jgi:hypothetical protein
MEAKGIRRHLLIGPDKESAKIVGALYVMNSVLQVF